MKFSKLLLAMAASGIATSAFATNGYFAHGIGVKAKAMGGASIAFAEDGFGAAANPANLAQVKDGYSVGVSAFAPDRASTISTGSVGGNEAADAFAVPEFVYNKTHNDKINWGVVVYGNGGMNVDYGQSIYDAAGCGQNCGLGANRTTTSNLEQLFIAPTISYKINDRNTVGASLNLVYQRFEATGLGNFSGFTSNQNTDPGNHGVDDASGVGIKLGWNGTLSDSVTAGAFYQPKTSMDKFTAYKDLFAQGGGFDIPETYGVGIAVKASPKTNVALDVVQINYSGIKSLANLNDNMQAGGGALGTENGLGFGWSDMTVYKLGMAHQMDANTTIRAGWNYGKQPISASQLDFNLLAPAVVEHHFTFGMTRVLDKNSDFSIHAMYAPKVELNGVAANASASDGTGSVSKLEMSQYEIGVQYSKKF